jgi:formylmethanofuran dehydrogenase subunit E
MAEIRKTYTVKVVAEYWATIEAEAGQELTTSEIEDLAATQMYDESHRIEIYSTAIDDEQAECDECGESQVEDDHECDEEEEGE